MESQPLEDQLRVQVGAALYGGGISEAQSGRYLVCTLISKNDTVADGQSVYRIGDDYIALIAADAFPDTALQEASKMQAMKMRLGGQVGHMVLDVRAQGLVNGRSFLVVDRCDALPQGRIRGRLGRWMIRRQMLQWLRQVGSLAAEPDTDAQQEFLASLQALESMPALPDAIRREANTQMEKIQAHPFLARHVPMHDDLWVGNIMRRGDGSLIVIDWAGSQIHGYGLYDLIRLSQSLRLPRSVLAAEIAWHGEVLGDVRQAPMLHLLGALGYYACHLGEFPVERFVGLSMACYKTLEEI